MRATRERMVVVGAGLAGLRAAERLRELGFDGELVIVGAEQRRPYHRPPLSKQFLLGDLHARDLELHSYVRLDAQWRLGTEVRRLDPVEHVLYLANGEELRYDGLVIATGVLPRRLPGAPRNHPRVHLLRTIDDAIGVQRMLAETDGPIAVVGGGFTSCELAATLRELGRDVLLVARSKILLGDALGVNLGEAIGRMHTEHGVTIAMGTEVRHWVPGAWGFGLHLSNGELAVVDGAVLAVGSVPAVGWLRGSGLDTSDGVLCGPTCHVAGADDIVAAGDVARWPNFRFDATPRRIEHWLNAVEMGRAAAESLLAGRDAAKPFTPLPRFWSEQYGVRFQAAGMPRLAERTTRLHADPATGAGVQGYVANGELVGVVGRESPQKILRWTAELDQRLAPLAGLTARPGTRTDRRRHDRGTAAPWSGAERSRQVTSVRGRGTRLAGDVPVEHG